MKKLSIFSLMIILCISLMSCSGTGDWSFELPNNYEMWHINSNDIHIKYIGDNITNGSEIPNFIKEFAYNERYVFTRNVKDIKSNNILEEVYYILDTQEQKICGEYNSVGELYNGANFLGIEIPETWYRTNPDPNIYINN